MRLSNRDSIAKDIESRIFSNKTVWQLIFPIASDGIRFVTSRNYSDRRLFEKLNNNVRKKIAEYGGQLKEIYTFIDNKKVELDYSTAEEIMGKVIRDHLVITIKIMIRSKYYEYTIGH